MIYVRDIPFSSLLFSCVGNLIHKINILLP